MVTIKLEQQGHVGILTINRPEALNALNDVVLSDLSKALDEVESNHDIYVIVLTGEGRSFVAGADIAQMRDFGAVEAKAFGDAGNAVFLKLENLQKPVIAAVNGFALGGGCELAMACDIRIASEKAKFGQPEVGLGITPGFGGTQRLPRLVGIPKPWSSSSTARVIGADEAKEIGLVNQVVPAEALMETAAGHGQFHAAQAQVAVRAPSSASAGHADRHRHRSLLRGLAFAVCCDTEDQYDAMDAFVKKEKLNGFKNR
jgi:enoyl-CoA hydratase